MKLARPWRGLLGLGAAVVLAACLALVVGPAPVDRLASLVQPNHQTHVVDDASPVVPWDGSEVTSGKVEVSFVACGVPFDHADVRETDRTVTITVHLRKLPLPPSGISYGCAPDELTTQVVSLHAPLGDRRLLDGFFIPPIPPSPTHYGTDQSSP